jgi:hypothetical protein
MQRTFSWRPGVLAAVAMTLLALLPQAHLWYTRGGDWHGAYASFDGDETAYAAYLAALIEGRPRLSDPYSGRDHAPTAPQAESLFSIQFVPAYALALPARALGLDASTVFIALSPLVAFFAALALFWLLALLLGDARLAACGAVVVLCLGALAAGGVSLAPLLKLRASHVYLPFLRRYVPALPFPLLFIFCALVCRALAQASRRAAVAYAVAAGATFALMVYSYFYHWTTAAAWLACLALLWPLAARREDDKIGDDKTHAAAVFLTTAALACAALAPYALLLARRAATMDKVQVLKFTRAPDLFRAPEIVAFVALVLLAFGMWRKKRLHARDTTFLFAASFALTPFVVFNQQLLTGRSLQPVHYADYVLNYLSLVALTLAAAPFLLRTRDESNALRPRADGDAALRGLTPETRRLPLEAHHSPLDTHHSPLDTRRRTPTLPRHLPARALLLLCVALAAYGWAAFELIATTRRFAPVNRARDEQAGVAARLSELARANATAHSGAGTTVHGARPVVLATSFMLADNLPSGAPGLAVLWSPHMHVYSGLTADEHRRRVYQFFYYTGVAPENFRAYLDANPLFVYTLFGAERVLPRLTTEHAPPTVAEFDGAARAYAGYVAAFTREQAAEAPLSYVVASPERPHDLSALDRWYERDAGVRVGAYTIQRVRLRP